MLMAALFSGCYQVPENTNIPSKPVGFVIDTETSDIELRDGLIGNCRIYDDTHPAVMSSGYGHYGVSGVAVVRAMDDQLYAFDCCCPYEAKAEVALASDGYFLTCPECGSSFEIGNGSGQINKGPATQILKKYKVTYQSGYRYRITR